MVKDTLVRRPDDLTVAWAQRVVCGHARNVTVSRVEVLSTDVGTTTRVRIAVEHDGLEALPRRWFVKLPSRSRRARWLTALPRLLNTEARFYREVAPSVPVRQPRMLAARSRLGRGSTLALGDVTEHGATTGVPHDALTIEQALLVISQLARLHAHFWNQANLHTDYGWLAGPVRRLEDRLGTILAVPLMERGLRLAGNVIPAALHGPALDYSRRRSQVMRVLADGPQTLVHHDLHPGNLYWDQDGPGFLDWQLVRIGEGIGDIAYFLATALEPEVRRACERHLLSHYQELLAEGGVGGLDSGHLLQRYRAHLVYPFEAMVVTLAVGGMMKRESNLELIRRAAAAVEDHDALGIGTKR